MISVCIPTYNEAPVVEKTLRQAARVLAEGDEPFEFIVVDDNSPDGTAAIVERLSAELPVRIHCRRETRGLATAVLKGWELARGEIVGVMDADLQHPPEVVLRLLQALRTSGADIAIASRYLPGGGSEGWSWFRRLVSWGGMRLGSLALPWTLGGITDSGSGLFLVRKRAIEDVDLQPLGFKLLLEVLAKGRYRKVVQVPYTFRGRTLGVSKLGPRQYVEYLVALVRVGRYSGELGTWARFAIAGLLGAVTYVGVLVGLERQTDLALPLVVAAGLLAALLVRYLLDEHFSFSGARPEPGSGRAHRFLRYLRLVLPSALLGGMVTVLGRAAGLKTWSAATVGLGAALAWDGLFVIPSLWALWRPATGRGEIPPSD